MEIIVYSDESGTFDKAHNDIFVFGGLILLSTESRDNVVRKYKHVESIIRKSGNYSKKEELKACKITNKQKGEIFRSLNDCIRFGVVIKQNCLLDRIFEEKKSKQRYLDYAFKIGLKNCLKALIAEGKIKACDVDSMQVHVDEHTTATNGRYELRECLEQEFKVGTFNMKYDKFFPPLFPNMKSVDLDYCNSAKITLIRAADIIANKIYFETVNNNCEVLCSKVYMTYLP